MMTVEQIDLAKDMWAKGDSAGLISSRLGVTRNTIIGKIDRLGLLRHPKGPRTGHGTRMASQPTKRRPHPQRASRRAEAGHAARPTARPPARPWVEPKTPLGVSLVDNYGCRYPFGEVTGRHQLFCGLPQADESSYCPHHRWLCARHETPNQPAKEALS